MDGLCTAFAKLAANCEGGTMMEDVTIGNEQSRQQEARSFGNSGGRIAGAGRGRGGMMAPSSGWAQGPSWAKPYEKESQAQANQESLTAALESISDILTPVPETCGCQPPTRENIYLGMTQTAADRGRWDDAPIEEVRHKVAEMAKLGTEDNQMCVPWRVCPRHTLHLPVTNKVGEQFEADFVIVAPSPQKYYEGETIVFTPKVAVQPTACLLGVLTTLECKFKACWEMAHLVSLNEKDKRERAPYSANLLCCLARARNIPEETPWAIIRPFARPPDAIAPPVAIVMNVAAPGAEDNSEAVADSAFKDILKQNDQEDTTVVLRPLSAEADMV
eukprot:TRINITY_DN1347_c0_g2_i5.p1 TRINITY_DN1347_c0_g2~~TRINITY_DN1347_c0_g2_i5.p1  ORF type:complete len:332 (+),score=34.93 TRINITY_DN1347_c0_g2_i5:114-1109(+)